MTYSSILDDVISGLQPEDLPTEFIVLAKIIDDHGAERILRGEAVSSFLNDPNRAHGISEARVVLDMSKIRWTIAQVMTAFFEELDAQADRLMAPPADDAET